MDHGVNEEWLMTEPTVRWVAANMDPITGNVTEWRLIVGKLMGRRKQRCVATVWANGTWHTWDHRGVGGENSKEETAERAKIEAAASAIAQSFV